SPRREPGNPAGPIEDRVLGVDVEVDEGRLRHSRAIVEVPSAVSRTLGSRRTPIVLTGRVQSLTSAPTSGKGAAGVSAQRPLGSSDRAHQPPIANLSSTRFNPKWSGRRRA